MEDTQEKISENLDNSSDVVETEPENISDNSEAAEQEPENAEETQEPENFGKFKTSDELLKAYNELEKKHGQQSNELGELRKIADEAKKLQEQIESQKLSEANQKGFETVRDYENHKEMNKFEADAYRKHINECDFPDEMEKLLNEFEVSPTKELRETIESQFPLETIKDVAVNKKFFEGQLAQKEQQALQKELENSARAFLDEAVPKHIKEFENPAFTQLFTEAFTAFGCDFQADKFVELLHQYADYVNKSKDINDDIKNENSDATDAIGFSNNGAKGAKAGANLLSLSPEAASARLAQLI